MSRMQPLHFPCCAHIKLPQGIYALRQLGLERMGKAAWCCPYALYFNSSSQALSRRAVCCSASAMEVPERVLT